ncbi:hypothetical protein ACFQV2_20045 [Actinokineospora soli]|uniref:Uncharacterized protein n=1 Tax=Actinokineospora soli TaxID=1048753 RepID=A0ABW2TNT3_9PSEU
MPTRGGSGWSEGPSRSKVADSKAVPRSQSASARVPPSVSVTETDRVPAGRRSPSMPR